MNTNNKKVETEFNNWVSEGISERMKHNHYFLWERIYKEGNFKKNSTVLDLACGEGWAAIDTAAKVPEGFVLGVDISPAMIDIACKHKQDMPNVFFLSGDVSGLTYGEEQFSHAYSIEALYYMEELRTVLQRMAKSLKPGGAFLTAIDFYKENPYTSCWPGQIGIPMFSYSTAEYTEMLKEAGFHTVETGRINDPSPLPDSYEGKWFKDVEELRNFHKEGSLLLKATK